MKQIIKKINTLNAKLYIKPKSKAIFTKARVADVFDDFFKKIFPRLSRKIPEPTRSFESCLGNNYPNMAIEPPSVNKLLKRKRKHFS